MLIKITTVRKITFAERVAIGRMQTPTQADQVTVTGTGYFGASRTHVRQLAWRLGASYSGDLTHGVTTHLVCKDSSVPASEKVNIARSWGIPVVDHTWLIQSIANEAVLPVESYALPALSSSLHRGLPDSVITRASKDRTATGCAQQKLCTDAQHSGSTDCLDIELLRAADSTTTYQLADLLLSTALSPNSGMSAYIFKMCFT